MNPEVKTKDCFNCTKQIGIKVTFCPHCGQKNDSNNLRLKAVFHEFIENYISFDSRLGRSIVPFLFRPGLLTKEFNAGRRTMYANPFRLYILVSIFFFFVYSQFIQTFDNLDFTVNGKVLNTMDSLKFDKEIFFSELNQSTNNQLNEDLSPIIKEQLYELKGFGIVQTMDSLSDYRKKKVLEIIPDKMQAELNLPPDKKYADASAMIGFSFDDGFSFSLEEFDLDIVSRYRYNREVGDEEVLDKMKLDNLSSFNTSFLLQLIRVLRGDPGTIGQYIVGNFAFAMFFMIPMFALLLMLVNYRKQMVFVEHLIHSLHVHSFAFFIIGSSLLLIMAIWNLYFALICNLLVSILLLIYFYKSSKMMYMRKGISTFLRILVVAVLYYFVFLFTLIVEVYISILLY
ncbi:MAG: hypothetical protein CMO34_02705 [Verrucomicrobia bacterium]|nr:hypothetical protein [Verrucomicrobiota bacterium]